MTRLETKCIKRYFERGYSRGRGAFARAADYVALRLILLLSAFLLLRPHMELVLAAALSVILLLLFMLVLRLIRQTRFTRYRDREIARISALLLEQKLVLSDEDVLERLCRPLLLPGERSALILRAEPCGADALLPYARARLSFAVCAPAGFSDTAERFAKNAAHLRLVPKHDLLAAAANAGLTPDGWAVAAYILQQETQRQAGKKRRLAKPFTEVAASKYLVCALLLFLMSFLSRYTLYCRMLAGLCMSLFAAGATLFRTRAPGGSIE